MGRRGGRTIGVRKGGGGGGNEEEEEKKKSEGLKTGIW